MKKDKRISPNEGKYGEEYWLNYTINTRYQASLSRAKKSNSLPLWANRDKIKKIYQEAVLLSHKTGQKYEVDHIIPLKNENICGLHVDSNLRIITKTENIKKSNDFSDS